MIYTVFVQTIIDCIFQAKMDILARKTTVSKMFLSPLSVRVHSHWKEFILSFISRSLFIYFLLSVLRGMDTFAMVAALTKMFLPPLSEGIYSERREFAPQSKFFPLRVEPFSVY